MTTSEVNGLIGTSLVAYICDANKSNPKEDIAMHERNEICNAIAHQR